MAALSRREFIATTGALAGAFMLPQDLLAQALAAPQTPSQIPTTLQQTIRLGQQTGPNFYQLTTAPGEPYLPRIDVTGKEPDPARTKSRRSLAYLGHFSDIHLIDAQTPGRLEPLIAVAAAFIDASRPQDTMTVQVLSQMVTAMSAARRSPLTGAPMTAAINTGDSADSMNQLELEWCIDTLDGATIVPNSGAIGQYQGVQVWPEADYVFHPYDPDINDYGTRGYPFLPDVLTAAVDQKVVSPGLPVPWYTTYGNHDTLFMGNIQVEGGLQAWAIGDKKNAEWPETTNMLVNWWATNGSMFQQMINVIRQKFTFTKGLYTVTPNPERKLFDQIGFMKAHLDSPAVPGPVGHGFTQANVDNLQTYWKADLTPWLRIYGIDTCNQVTGADGAVPQDQFDWLQNELSQLAAENKLGLVCSHHNSVTLENPAQPSTGPTQNLIHADEFVAMLQKYPNMIAWINGHTHMNTITAHPKQGGGGFWEITTASCVDFPQQQQLIEIVDNRDGTLSIFATTLDHDSPATWTTGDYSQTGLASLSRTLAANAWQFEPLPKLGSHLDRNTELLLPAPFDLSVITDKALEQQQAQDQARLVANEAKAVQQ